MSGAVKAPAPQAQGSLASALTIWQSCLDPRLLGWKAVHFYSWPVGFILELSLEAPLTAVCTTFRTIAPVLLWLAACSARAELDAPSLARLQTFNAAPELAGELIYQGRTFARDVAQAEPLFRYERRVRDASPGMVATHLTRDASQRLVIAEEARVDAAYQLQGFSAQNLQLGYSGTVQVSQGGRHLQYSLVDNGVASTAQETIEQPAVSGPSLFGFILAHAKTLESGQTVPVRFVVLKDKRSYGLDIRKEPSSTGQGVYAISASRWWLRPWIAPMRLTVDHQRGTIVRYEGRVPPLRAVAGQWAELDARVEYTPRAPTFR